MIGQTISHYRIVEKVGEGGMGVVYVAEDSVLGRRVAIKTLTLKPGQNEQHFRTRFLREARAVSALSHPNIATIHDYGETDKGEPFIVMELVKGGTLNDLLNGGQLTIARALEIIKQVADALDEAHRNGIVHRDIKPSNVAINQRGEVKVLDFGLAKQLNLDSFNVSDPERQTLLTSQTQEGVIVGTPLYLSPEQALGSEIDARSDIFALGSLLYECVAGQPAFDGATRMEICTKIIRDDPVPPSKLNPDVPAAVDKIVQKALAKKTTDRYQSVDEMADELANARAAFPEATAYRAVRRLTSSRAQPTGALATLSDIFRRPRISVGYVVAGVVAITLIAVLAWWLTRPTPYQPRPETQRLYDLGVNAMREGAFFKSKKILEQVVSQDDRFALARARLAEACTELDFLDQAKDELIRANDLVNTQEAVSDLDGLRLQAITNTIKRDFAAAVENYRQLVAAVPVSDKAFALVDQGRAYEKNEQWGQAAESYREATALNQNYGAAFLRLGIALQHDQKYPDAIAAFDQADHLYKLANEIEGLTETMLQRGVLLVKQGKFADAQDAFRSALQRSEALENTEQRIRILQEVSYTFATAGDSDKSRQYSEQATQLAQTNRMENLTTSGLIQIGNSYLVKGDYVEAEKNYSEALRLAQLFKGRSNEARALLSLANSRHSLGDPDTARDFAQKALTFYQQGGYGTQILFAYMFLGRASAEIGEYDAAEKNFQDLLQSAAKVGDPRFVALGHEGLGLVYLQTDRMAEALAHFDEEYKTAKAIDAKGIFGNAAENSGVALWRLGRYEEALAKLTEAQALAQPEGAEPIKDLLGDVTSSFAEMAVSQRKFSEAIGGARKALEIGGSLKTVPARTGITLCLAQTLSGGVAAGRAQCDAAVKIAGKLRNPLLLSQALLASAEAALAAGDAQSALNAATEAQKRFSAAKQRDHEWRASAIAARSAEKIGDKDKARQLASEAARILKELEPTFGSDNYRSYLGRADVKDLQSQLTALSSP